MADARLGKFMGLPHSSQKSHKMMPILPPWSRFPPYPYATVSVILMLTATSGLLTYVFWYK